MFFLPKFYFEISLPISKVLEIEGEPLKDCIDIADFEERWDEGILLCLFKPMHIFRVGGLGINILELIFIDEFKAITGG